jgi:hypothetical protein
VARFTIQKHNLFSIDVLKNNIFLFVIDVFKKPPHIGISYFGKYFSLKHNSKDETSVDVIIKLIQNKRIPSLFFQLKEDIFEESKFKEIISNFTSIKVDQCTCLTPINKLVLNNDENFILPELLNYLEIENKIVSVLSLNINKQSIIIDYTFEELSSFFNNIKRN